MTEMNTGGAAFPACYGDCEIVRILGVGECESVCHDRIREYDSMLKARGERT